MDFKEWLKKYEGDDNGISELAKLIEPDKNFPSGKDKDEINEYIKNEDPEVIAAVDRAWVLFETSDK